ncbi:PHP domain-containing protein [bacterium]|nr:MAG: PHP domain-containing protein [bacterium]
MASPEEKFIDLHLHTSFSDGTLTPEELISLAAASGLSAIAVTDHDTVAGLSRSIESGREMDIEVLAGIELSAEYEGKELHILGYLVDYENKNLLKQLNILKENRIKRIYDMAEKLNGLGLRLSPQDIFAASLGSVVGRLHVARAMVQQGLVTSTQEAFQKYIGDNCPAYVLGFKFSPKEAIRLIKEIGGIPVLAHPYTVNNDAVLLKLIEDGLMGLEAYYPEHSQAMTNFYLNLAKENNLLVTGGSDFHGNSKPAVKMGCMKIPYCLVDTLRKAQKKL